MPTRKLIILWLLAAPILLGALVVFILFVSSFY